MASAPPTKTVPLIPSGPVSEFGSFEPDEKYFAQMGTDRDGTYVPGFSDLRKKYDIAVGRFNRGEIPRSEVPQLPVNMRWARNQNRKGDPDTAKQFAHGRKGYRMVTKDDLGKDWLTETPGGAMWDAAGNLRNGDTVLMVTDAKNAARNKALREAETLARVQGVTASVAATNLQSVPKGADPYVQRIAATQ